MVVIITGASHTGKTLLAQRILEKKKFSYLSIDHLKMGLIRSGSTDLTPYDDDRLTPYLWSIVKEIIKTAIENGQNLTVEGCYVPFDWQKDFSDETLKSIRYVCLVMTDRYIEENYSSIMSNSSVIEKRLDDSCCTKGTLKRDNSKFLKGCESHGLYHYDIDEKYNAAKVIDLLFPY